MTPSIPITSVTSPNDTFLTPETVNVQTDHHHKDKSQDITDLSISSTKTPWNMHKGMVLHTHAPTPNQRTYVTALSAITFSTQRTPSTSMALSTPSSSPPPPPSTSQELVDQPIGTQPSPPPPQLLHRDPVVLSMASTPTFLPSSSIGSSTPIPTLNLNHQPAPLTADSVFIPSLGTLSLSVPVNLIYSPRTLIPIPASPLATYCRQSALDALPRPTLACARSIHRVGGTPQVVLRKQHSILASPTISRMTPIPGSPSTPMPSTPMTTNVLPFHTPITTRQSHIGPFSLSPIFAPHHLLPTVTPPPNGSTLLTSSSSFTPSSSSSSSSSSTLMASSPSPSPFQSHTPSHTQPAMPISFPFDVAVPAFLSPGHNRCAALLTSEARNGVLNTFSRQPPQPKQKKSKQQTEPQSPLPAFNVIRLPPPTPEQLKQFHLRKRDELRLDGPLRRLAQARSLELELAELEGPLTPLAWEEESVVKGVFAFRKAVMEVMVSMLSEYRRFMLFDKEQDDPISRIGFSSVSRTSQHSESSYNASVNHQSTQGSTNANDNEGEESRISASQGKVPTGDELDRAADEQAEQRRRRFQVEEFLKTVDKDYRPFVERLCQTQMFSFFIDARASLSRPDWFDLAIIKRKSKRAASTSALRDQTISGFLWKQGSLFRTWKRRFFVLQGLTLTYFEVNETLEKLVHDRDIAYASIFSDPRRLSQLPSSISMKIQSILAHAPVTTERTANQGILLNTSTSAAAVAKGSIPPLSSPTSSNSVSTSTSSTSSASGLAFMGPPRDNSRPASPSSRGSFFSSFRTSSTSHPSSHSSPPSSSTSSSSSIPNPQPESPTALLSACVASPDLTHQTAGRHTISPSSASFASSTSNSASSSSSSSSPSSPTSPISTRDAQVAALQQAVDQYCSLQSQIEHLLPSLRLRSIALVPGQTVINVPETSESVYPTAFAIEITAVERTLLCCAEDSRTQRAWISGVRAHCAPDDNSEYKRFDTSERYAAEVMARKMQVSSTARKEIVKSIRQVLTKMGTSTNTNPSSSTSSSSSSTVGRGYTASNMAINGPIRGSFIGASEMSTFRRSDVNFD